LVASDEWIAEAKKPLSRGPLESNSAASTPFHVPAAINDQPIQGPKRDTVFVPKGERSRIGLDADDPGIWAFHCHISDHHARGMFNVVSYHNADLRWWDPEATQHEQPGI
jgi:hypothetical protein